MKIKTKKIINIILIILFIILLILLFLLLSGRTFSKYNSNINSNGIAEVAKPIFIVDGTENIKIDGIEDTIYNFQVKNYDGVEISHVDMNYNIEIINNSEANLTFELIKNGELLNLTNNKTETMTIDGITRHTDTYELKILYNDNPAITEDISGNIQIKVESVQTEVM